MRILTERQQARHRLARKVRDRLFVGLCAGATVLGAVILFVLLGKILVDGVPHLDRAFFTNFASQLFPERSGIKAALVGSLAIMALTALFTVPIGVAAAIYLEEFVDRPNRFVRFLTVNISNLAGVPSIVYGLLGLAVFLTFLRMEKGLLVAALTMSLLILPVVILVSREALKAVPRSYREGALALGATKWQTIFGQVLPAARGGIFTGIILSLSRAIGETAPLLVVGAVSFAQFLPRDINDAYTVLPIQIFDWIRMPNPVFHDKAAGAIVVLIVTLLGMNSLAIYLRYRSQKHVR